MATKILLKSATVAVIAACASTPMIQASAAPAHRHHGRYRVMHHTPRYRVNRYGYGNYVRGRNGSYGGYPAGSGGARELQINHELKCRYSPESC
ncbi:MAG TPA: hypothetical protein VH414_00875 [Lichenihabitans sp.]|jgi:hypothetical protein|nr:hypothetical protein [Lichenihabitans sp.]